MKRQNFNSLKLNDLHTEKVERTWGYWIVLEEGPGYKVKRLIINPGQCLSMQRHNFRTEHWYILKGQCEIETEYQGIQDRVVKRQNETYIIGKEVWHQGKNSSSEPCHILEVQFGEGCVEEDIERK